MLKHIDAEASGFANGNIDAENLQVGLPMTLAIKVFQLRSR